MLLHGDSSTRWIPEVKPTLHETVVCQSLAESPTFHRLPMAEAASDS